MFLLKSLIGIPGHSAARQGRVRGLSRSKRRPRPLLVEALENRLCLARWSEPVDFGLGVNSPYVNFGPNYFEDRNTGITTLYFASTRPDRLGIESIYASTLQSDGTFGAAVLVPELSSPSKDTRTAIRNDGLEMFIVSLRPGGIGTQDI